MPQRIVTRAPTRIDFGGGWTDVPPYSDEMGGFVCNIAISRYATVTVDRMGSSTDGPAATDPGDRSIAVAAARRFRMLDAHIEIRNDFPIGAGLGGSSAVGVATVAALAASRGEKMMPTAIAELSRDIEISDLGISGGRQDHYAAAYGGALGLRFANGRVDVRTIALRMKVKKDLERQCIVIYTGQSRVSGATIDAVLDAYRKKDPNVLEALRRMRQNAERMPETLVAGDLDALGRLVAEQWECQRSLHPSIPTQTIDDILARARDAGALGGKALGASGGGCVLVMARADRVQKVRDAIAPLGEILDFSIDESGVERCT
ncbi:MAG TPA: hypothetical protein VN706_15005 [Gemmatimonadaceae bacterium]|nr:hypothetical protein [Gemmatimonadaceae bacterium]